MIQPMFESRYVYHGTVVGLGGRITKYQGRSGLNIPIPVQGACSLPVVGGVSESKQEGCELSVREPVEIRLASAASIETRVSSDLEGSRADGGFATAAHADIRGVRILDIVSVERVLMDLAAVQIPGKEFPEISLGQSEITGLRLGDCAIKVDLDVPTFKTYNTKASLAEAFEKNPEFRKKNRRRFNTAEGADRIREFSGGYYVCSIVESIGGNLPQGAYLGDDGYTIFWPGIGRIVLGEMMISSVSRRLTMVRVHLGCPTRGDVGIGEGDLNGSSVP